jgi:hypothetical protein
VARYEQAALDRELDASDRRAAAEDRAAAARDRSAAASDERAAALDRAAAAEDRETARHDRVVAAQDRVRAAADREQAAVERAQHGRDAAPDWILWRVHRRMQAVRGRAQATARATADLVGRLIQAKEREVAAHLASIQVHERMASLQEGLGHPERAAKARAQAERARAFHRAASAELAEYVARIRTDEDGAGPRGSR